MSNDKEQVQVEFHNKANAMFFSIYHTFEHAVSGLSRRNEEYRFQQLKKQYAVSLEQELQTIAKHILMDHKYGRDVNEIDPVFHQFIKDYLHRFIQKINDL
jgi:hypothetical protein